LAGSRWSPYSRSTELLAAPSVACAFPNTHCQRLSTGGRLKKRFYSSEHTHATSRDRYFPLFSLVLSLMSPGTPFEIVRCFSSVNQGTGEAGSSVELSAFSPTAKQLPHFSLRAASRPRMPQTCVLISFFEIAPFAPFSYVLSFPDRNRSTACFSRCASRRMLLIFSMA